MGTRTVTLLGTMRTCIEVTGSVEGRPRWRAVTGDLSPRLIASGPGHLRIGLLATTALLLAGDAVELVVTVCGDVCVELVEIAGTVAYDMRGGTARWHTSLTLRQGAQLDFSCEPFVVAAGAVVDRSLVLDAEDGCRATLREPLVLGRSGEVGGTLRTVSALRYDDRDLLVETLDLAPEVRSSYPILAGARCLTTTTTVGHRLPDGPGVVQLEGPGSIRRSFADQLHQTLAHPAREPDHTWSEARATAAPRRTPRR